MRITFQTKSGVFDVECEAGDNVLYAGLRSGLFLPYECATGTCGTCRCRVMEGAVDLQWRDAPGLAYVKSERSETLMCQAQAGSDCTVRVPAAVARLDGAPDERSGRLSAAEKLTHDVMGFSVRLDAPISYRAGQFVVLRAPGIAGGRAYSMVNYAASVDSVDFVVKRKPGGTFSDWLFDGAPCGSEVRLFGPLGKGTFDPAEDKDILCIAGGSGIAGIMAILEHGARIGYLSDHSADVFFGVRRGDDLFFADELSRYVEASPETVTVTVALSEDEPDDALQSRFPRLRFAQGLVHSVASKCMADRYDNVIGYVAGPPPMVDGALRVLVLEGRLPSSDIRYDKFS
jgi:toluene monooxygenase electron transfer component